MNLNNATVVGVHACIRAYIVQRANGERMAGHVATHTCARVAGITTTSAPGGGDGGARLGSAWVGRPALAVATAWAHSRASPAAVLINNECADRVRAHCDRGECIRVCPDRAGPGGRACVRLLARSCIHAYKRACVRVCDGGPGVMRTIMVIAVRDG